MFVVKWNDEIKSVATASYRRWLLIWQLKAVVRDVDNMNFLLPWMAIEKTAVLNILVLLTFPSGKVLVSYTLTGMNMVCSLCACKRRPVRIEVSHRQPQQWLYSRLEIKKKEEKSHSWCSKLKVYEAILSAISVVLLLDKPSLSAGVSQSGGSHPGSHLHSILWSQTCNIYTYINSSKSSYKFWCMCIFWKT